MKNFSASKEGNLCIPFSVTLLKCEKIADLHVFSTMLAARAGLRVLSLPKGDSWISLGQSVTFPPKLLSLDARVLSLLTRFRSRLCSNQSLPVLPPSLTHIRFADRFAQPLPIGVFPSSVTHIHFSSWNRFNHPLSRGVLPSQLVSLDLGGFFDQRLEVGQLPSSLQNLMFKM